ncbi:VOC family protein [Fundicoccus culcitae]|uniref:VOC family protein n=1 Tax=Fundicoccus culcitae TaxID=2969821 RepID=A0ABY5PA84_9LACT|nr:VOC family protein [Fundicoccus culcitae]UUX35489.1 VOC family protein [Fundicoccus culcitae]
MNRINLIALGVRDMAKALSFYRALGFKTYETQANPPIVFFDNAGTKLELFPIDELTRDIYGDDSFDINDGFQRFPGITLAINMKTKDEVDTFFDKVRQLGGKIVKEAEFVFWGGYSGYFQDLDGYYWEVAYADSWKFDDNDMLIIEP